MLTVAACVFPLQRYTALSWAEMGGMTGVAELLRAKGAWG